MKGLKVVRHRHSDALTRVGWDQLEALLAAYYRSEGYEVEHVGTGATGAKFDGGIDLKLRRAEEFIVVQCKHWNAMKVPHNAVHELLGLMVNHGATGAILATSGEFTRAAIDAAARRGHVQLIDGDELRMMLGPIREPGAEFASIRMGAHEGSGMSVARRVGERLLSAAEDRIRYGGNGRGRRSAPRNRVLALGLKLVVFLLFMAFVVFMYQQLARTIQGIAPVPPPPATTAAPAVLSAPVSVGPSMADPCREVIDAATGSYIDRCAGGASRPAATPDNRADRKRADEAMQVISESTPEL